MLYPGLRHSGEACPRVGGEPVSIAAHIIQDSDLDGFPEVSNGLASCKIHHVAFDSGIIGIQSDYVIKAQKDVLRKEGGPILKYGL